MLDENGKLDFAELSKSCTETALVLGYLTPNQLNNEPLPKQKKSKKKKQTNNSNPSIAAGLLVPNAKKPKNSAIEPNFEIELQTAASVE